VSRRHAHREIEVKLAVVVLTALVGQLHRLGARSHGRILEQNTLYDTPDSDFRRAHRLLRLRIETPARSAHAHGGLARGILTSKVPLPVVGAQRRRRPPKYKEKLESEMPIALPQRWPEFLKALGFRPGFRYEKYRTTFRLPGLELDLDETPVGVFLELEGEPRAIDRVARQLGYSPREYIRLTYWDLYAANCRRRGVVPTNMVFDT
jgi:adenylate cyclase class 2